MAHVVTVDEALDLLETGNEAENFILVRLFLSIQQVHEFVDSFFVATRNHVKKSAASYVAPVNRKRRNLKNALNNLSLPTHLAMVKRG